MQVYDMPDKDGWDAHEDLKGNHVPRARWTDQPVAALLADLKQRGLLRPRSSSGPVSLAAHR